jgi:hypothetical protein
MNFTGAGIVTPSLSQGSAQAQSAITVENAYQQKLLDKLDKLDTNLTDLRFEVRSNVTHTHKVAKILDRVVRDGENVNVIVNAN